MKKAIVKLSFIVLAVFLYSCSGDNSKNQENTGNGSMESPTNGDPPPGDLEPKKDTTDNTRVVKDTLHP